MNYSLNCTYDCNWNCSYCIIETHTRPKRDIEKVFKDIEKIPNKSNVSLGGGEPGLLSLENIIKIIKKLKNKNCTIDLLTNGLFLENFGELSIMKEFDTIHYHCVQNLDDNIKFPNLENVDYQIVVNNKNFENLESFLKKYPEIKFSIIPSKNIEPLSKSKAFDIIRKYKHRMTERSISEFFDCACEGTKYIG
jgi:organic radical activating enzyme